MLLPAIVCTAPAAEAEEWQEMVVQAEIRNTGDVGGGSRSGDFLGFGFGSLWMMSGTSLVRVDPDDNSFIEIEIGVGAIGRSVAK